MPKLTNALRLLLLIMLLTVVACDPADDDDTDDPERTEAPPATAVVAEPENCDTLGGIDTPYLYPDTETLGQTMTCGTLDLPQDPNNPDGPQHTIAYVILFSSGDSPASDPVVFLAGGPGTSAILSSADWLTHPLRTQRDIILIDQRGAGYSIPSLDCDAYGLAGDDEACLAAIDGAGVDRALYHTGNNAADMHAVMAHLQSARGYTTFNLYGVSYGTRLALAIMRDYPDDIRSVVLDSPYPPQVSSPVELAANTERALEAMFAACAADTVCNDAYPDVRSDFLTITDFLNEVPIEGEDGDYFGRNFISDVYVALSDNNYLPIVPAAINAMVEQEFGLALQLLYNGPEGLDVQGDLLALYDEYDDDDVVSFFTVAAGRSESEGMYLVFECQEETFFNTLEDAQAFTSDAGVEPLIADARLTDTSIIFAQCEGWFVSGAPELENIAVSSDIPTLILSGELDPITPPNWADATAETLPNSTVVKFPLASHATYGAGPCPQAIGAAFIGDPVTAPDTTCIAEMSIPFEVYTIE